MFFPLIKCIILQKTISFSIQPLTFCNFGCFKSIRGKNVINWGKNMQWPPFFVSFLIIFFPQHDICQYFCPPPAPGGAGSNIKIYTPGTFLFGSCLVSNSSNPNSKWWSYRKIWFQSDTPSVYLFICLISIWIICGSVSRKKWIRLLETLDPTPGVYIMATHQNIIPRPPLNFFMKFFRF